MLAAHDDDDDIVCQNILFQVIHFRQTVLIKSIQLSLSIDFVYTQLNVKTVLNQTIPFSISKQFTCHNSSISSNSV